MPSLICIGPERSAFRLISITSLWSLSGFCSDGYIQYSAHIVSLVERMQNTYTQQKVHTTLHICSRNVVLLKSTCKLHVCGLLYTPVRWPDCSRRQAQCAACDTIRPLPADRRVLDPSQTQQPGYEETLVTSPVTECDLSHLLRLVNMSPFASLPQYNQIRSRTTRLALRGTGKRAPVDNLIRHHQQPPSTISLQFGDRKHSRSNVSGGSLHPNLPLRGNNGL